MKTPSHKMYPHQSLRALFLVIFITHNFTTCPLTKWILLWFVEFMDDSLDSSCHTRSRRGMTFLLLFYAQQWHTWLAALPFRESGLVHTSRAGVRCLPPFVLLIDSCEALLCYFCPQDSEPSPSSRGLHDITLSWSQHVQLKLYSLVFIFGLAELKDKSVENASKSLSDEET